MSKKGKSPLIFVKPGNKINSEYYVSQILEKGLGSWVKDAFGEDVWTFQQDSAPSHSSTITQNWCKDNLPNFISKDEWPPNSPDLNPMDFSIWAELSRKACAKPHSGIPALKRALKEAWRSLSVETIVNSCNSFKTQLEKVIAAEGGHFE